MPDDTLSAVRLIVPVGAMLVRCRLLADAIGLDLMLDRRQ